MADEARVVKWLGNQLSRQERQVLALQAELRSSPMLSRWEDLSADADAMLNPVLLGIRFRIVTIPPPRQRRVMGGFGGHAHSDSNAALEGRDRAE